MTQETLVILVNLVVHQRFLLGQLGIDGTLEALYNLTQDRLIKHQLLAVHYTLNIMAGQQFASLENDAVGTSVQDVDPQFLIQNFAREDQHLDIRMHLLRRAAYLNTDGSRATQSEVK